MYSLKTLEERTPSVKTSLSLVQTVFKNTALNFSQYGPLKSAAHSLYCDAKKKPSKTNNNENTPIAAHQLQHFCFRLSNNDSKKRKKDGITEERVKM